MQRPTEFTDEEIRNSDGIILVDRNDNELSPMPLRLSPPRGRIPGAGAAWINPAIRVLISSDDERTPFEARVNEVCGPTIASVFPQMERIVQHHKKDANDYAIVTALVRFIDGYVACSGFNGKATFAHVSDPEALVDFSKLDWMKLPDENGDVSVVAVFTAGTTLKTTVRLHRVDPQTQTYMIKAFGVEQTVNVQSRAELISFYQQITTRWATF